MTTWNVFCRCLRRSIDISAGFLLILSTAWLAAAVVPFNVSAQSPESVQSESLIPEDYFLLQLRLANSGYESHKLLSMAEDDEDGREEYPEPRSVLYKSLMIPGWGQVTNRQAWKVPIIYGLFAGLGYYNYYLTEQYRGYRAAYYNETRGDETDFKYGETPNFVPDGLTPQQLRQNRDSLRNQRDFSYILMALAYGLNALDAYVFAHMRSFDVSDDLSARTTVGPTLTGHGMPGIQLRVDLGTH